MNLSELHPSATQETGERFGNYWIRRPLAKGGMAEILLAHEMSTGRRVVLKRILPQLAADPEFLRFFVHEGFIGRQLSHPNIVETLDAGQVGGVPYLALEFLHGATAIELVRRASQAGRRLPLGVVIRMLADSARGLHHAHNATDPSGLALGLVHRDVTPHNLFVCKSGITKVLDFGIAKGTAQLHHTRTGTLKGKFGYLAPEQIRGEEIDHRVDVFALGIVLYELLTLRPLFRGSSDAATLHRVLTLEIPPPERLRREICPGLGAVALRALQRDPERRLPSAAAFADSLEAVAGAERIDASREAVASLLLDLFPETVVHEDSNEFEIIEVAGVAQDSAAALEVGLASAPGPVVLDEDSHRCRPAVFGPRRSALLIGGLLLLAAAFTFVRLRLRHLTPAAGGADLPPLVSPPPPPAQIVRLPVEKAPSPQGVASHVVVPPEDATLRLVVDGVPSVLVDGTLEHPRQDGLYHLAPGSHRVVVHSSRLAGPRSFFVHLDAGETAMRSLRARPGTLKLVALPWAEVTLDGSTLGTTPLAPTELSEGLHTVLLRNRDLGVKVKRTVMVRPDRETLLRVNLFENSKS